MTSNSKPKSGDLLRRYIGAAGTTQSALANELGVSRVNLNVVINGHRPPSSDWVDLISNTLNLTADQRAELHRAAARDHGFQIDLD